MIDNNGNIVTKKELLKRINKSIKENIAILSILFPIIFAAISKAFKIWFVSCKLGYYQYYNIDINFMLEDNENSIYINILYFLMGIVYVLYTRFSLEMWRIRKNYLWKLLCFLFIPGTIIGIFIHNKISGLALLFTMFIGIVLNVGMIFGFGYMMSPPEINMKKKVVWRDKQWRLFGVIMILGSITFMYLYGYKINEKMAIEQNEYGIVIIEDEQYVVIDCNKDKLLLKRCKVKGQTLTITKNTCLISDNDNMIQYYIFDEIRMIWDDEIIK